MQVRKQQLELDMEQHIGSKQEKGYVKAVYCHPAYLTSMHKGGEGHTASCQVVVVELLNCVQLFVTP